jgi:hypothetical protein
MTSSEFVRRKDFFREDYRGTKQQFLRPSVILKLGEITQIMVYKNSTNSHQTLFWGIEGERCHQVLKLVLFGGV